VSITFLASFPAIQSAIKIDGSGNGMRIQLDIPEVEMNEAVALLGLREVVLRVTIEPVIQAVSAGSDAKVSTRAKRQSKRKATKKQSANGAS
jgi:hypothetical protein